MGDRCYCTLTITGVIGSSEDWTEVMTAIKDAGTYEHVKVAPPLAGTSEPCQFSFEEVNYAQMDTDLVELLQELGLAYIWSNQAGDDYGPGCVVFDGKDTLYEESLTDNSELFVRLSEVGNAERIATLRTVEALLNTLEKGTLVYAPSAHSQIEIFANDPEALQGWKDRLARRAAKA